MSAVLGMLGASALHYASTLHAAGITDLADAIRTASAQIAAAVKGVLDGGK